MTDETKDQAVPDAEPPADPSFALVDEIRKAVPLLVSALSRHLTGNKDIRLVHSQEGTPALLHHNSESLQSLEPYLPGRVRYRGTFSTSILEQFIGYCETAVSGADANREDADDSSEVAFIDPVKMSATAFFNLGAPGAPGHGDWRAVCVLQPLAAYAAAIGIADKPHRQKAMAEWLEDWMPFLKARYAESDGQFADRDPWPAIKAVRSIKIAAKVESTHTDRQLGASRTAMEDIEAAASGENALPLAFVFNTAPYLGFDSRPIELRLAIITGDEPTFKLRITAKEQLVEDIAREFQGKLETALCDKVITFVGAFAP